MCFAILFLFFKTKLATLCLSVVTCDVTCSSYFVDSAPTIRVCSSAHFLALTCSTNFLHILLSEPILCYWPNTSRFKIVYQNSALALLFFTFYVTWRRSYAFSLLVLFLLIYHRPHVPHHFVSAWSCSPFCHITKNLILRFSFNITRIARSTQTSNLVTALRYPAYSTLCVYCDKCLPYIADIFDFSTVLQKVKNTVDTCALTRYYRGSSWIKNLCRSQKPKRFKKNRNSRSLAGGCFAFWAKIR